MKPLAKWVLRTVALWALTRALEMANDKLKQRRQGRIARPRTVSVPSARTH